MKKHWVEFTAVISGAVLVEGDETPSQAGEYVRRHIDFRAHVENEDCEINHHTVSIDHYYEEDQPKEAE